MKTTCASPSPGRRVGDRDVWRVEGLGRQAFRSSVARCARRQRAEGALQAAGGCLDRATFALAQLAFWPLAAGRWSRAIRRTSRSGIDGVVGSIWRRCTACCRLGRSSGAAQTSCLTSAPNSPWHSGTRTHYRLDEIHARHWQRLAASCGPGAFGRMTAMVEEVDNALQAVERRLPAGFPNRVWSCVTESMRRQLAQFLRSAV